MTSRYEVVICWSDEDGCYLASALLRMDKSAEALDLVYAARPRSPWLWFYLESPDFDEIRDDERFRQVVEASDGRAPD